MKQNREKTLAAILISEDSTLNVAKSEPGGASKYGVSVDFLTDYYISNKFATKATVADVSRLTADDATKIYDKMILDFLHFDDLPGGVDYRLADITVNLGRSGGPALLQLCLNIWPLTAVMDDNTMQHVHNTEPKALIMALSAAWLAKKHESPNWGPGPATSRGYGHGWTNRNISATAMALSMVEKT